jgi:hypothetical protein
MTVLFAARSAAFKIASRRSGIADITPVSHVPEIRTGHLHAAIPQYLEDCLACRDDELRVAARKVYCEPSLQIGLFLCHKISDVYLLRRPGGGFCFERGEHRTRAGAWDVGRLTNNDSMSSPDPDHERMSLTDRESPIRTRVADPRITHGRTMRNPAQGRPHAKLWDFSRRRGRLSWRLRHCRWPCVFRRVVAPASPADERAPPVACEPTGATTRRSSALAS